MSRTSIRFTRASRSTNAFSACGLLFGRTHLILFMACALLLSLNLWAQSQPTFLYTNDNTTTNTVTAFSVSTTGVLTPINVFPTGGTGNGAVLFGSNRVTVSAAGNFLFASNEGSNDVSAFSIDPNTGGLVLVGTFPTGGSGTSSLAATPDGKFLMAGNHASNDVTVFSIAANGALTPVGSPFPAGGPPDGMKISPNGLFLATGTTGTGGPVAVLSIGSNGALTPVSGSPFPGSGADTGIDIRCSGNQLFAGNFVSGTSNPTTVDVFSLALNGALTPIPGSPFHGGSFGSSGVLLSPNNQFLFVSNTNGDSITVFNVAGNGSLSQVVGSPFSVKSGGFPSVMATNQAGTFLFTANASLHPNVNASVGVFSVALDGSLTAVSPVVSVPGSHLSAIAVFPGSTCTNPVPQISQPLVPSATAAGGAGFPLTINGTGFVSSSVVNWNGVALPTTVVNGNQVTATVPASNVAVDGTASVTVTNPAPGGGTSNVAFFTTTTPTTNLSFSSFQVGVGNGPWGVAEGDFNGDGIVDLAVTNNPQNLGNTVSILLGNGDGTFRSQVTYSTGHAPFGIAVGDFNGDGKLDLAVTNAVDKTVSILLGNGDGTFRNQVAYSTPQGGPVGIVVGDFNGDGKLDLAVADTHALSILLGNGDGTFQNQVPYATGQGAFSITLGDFNGDGILDLAVTNYNNDTVSILLGNGDGTFQNQVTYPTGSSPQWITVGDFNGDGKLDLAVTNTSSSSVSVLLGNGDGSFRNQVTYPTGRSPYWITVGDFGGDNKVDLAITNSFDNTVSILLGNGDGTFQNQMTYPTGLSPVGVAVADFNGDGRLDLAVANVGANNVSILLQSPMVSISPASLNCGSQPVNTPVACSPPIALTNTGSAPLTITSIAITGVNSSDFSETDNCIPRVAAGASCNIQVTFAPTATGARSANLCFTDNAPGSPQCVPLSGTGTASPPSCTLSIQGGSSSLAISATASCVDPNATITSTTIDWGDGSQLTSGITGNHTYATAGTYTVRVTATNNFGQQGGAAQPVTVIAPSSAGVFPGQSASATLNITAPQNTTPTVIFQCREATLTNSSGQQTTQLASGFGISCIFSPSTATLSNTPMAVTLTCQTTGATVGLLRPSGSPWLSASLALSMPFSATVLLGSGFLGGSTRKRKALVCCVAVGLVAILLLISISCGGGFTPPPQTNPLNATPSGSYSITVAAIDTTTGFVQTSLIVPLTVAGNP